MARRRRSGASASTTNSTSASNEVVKVDAESLANLGRNIQNASEKAIAQNASACVKIALKSSRELLKKVLKTTPDYRLWRFKNGKNVKMPNTLRIRKAKTVSTIGVKKITENVGGQLREKYLGYFWVTKKAKDDYIKSFEGKPINWSKGKLAFTPDRYLPWLEFGTKRHRVGKYSKTSENRQSRELYYESKLREINHRIKFNMTTSGVLLTGRRSMDYANNKKYAEDKRDKIEERLRNVRNENTVYGNKENTGRWHPGSKKYVGKIMRPTRQNVRVDGIQNLIDTITNKVTSSINQTIK